LARRGVESLVAMLSRVPGVNSLSMTTNGFFLAEKAEGLREAGLGSVTVSLHSLKADRFEANVGARDVFTKVLAGIREARRVFPESVKINCVVTRGCNDDELVDFAELARRSGMTVRFIEYMPFDGRKIWDVSRVVSGKEIIEKIQEAYRLSRLPREPGSTAHSYSFADGSPGQIDVITSMTEPFCGDCDRIRLKADGKIVPCLFSTDEYDIKRLLRSGGSDTDLELFVRKAFSRKSPGVERMLKEASVLQHVRPMHTIGG